MSNRLVLPDDAAMATMRSRLSDRRLRAYLNGTCYAALSPSSVEFVFPERFRLHYEKTTDQLGDLSRELTCQVSTRLLEGDGA